jgi:hypothetical protein
VRRAGVDPASAASPGLPYYQCMNTDAPTQRIPVDTLHARADNANPGRMLVTVIAACFLAIGWGIGRFFHALGWVAGRVFRGCVFCGTAIAIGFELGAKLAPREPEKQPEPSPPVL